MNLFFGTLRFPQNKSLNLEAFAELLVPSRTEGLVSGMVRNPHLVHGSQ